MKSTSEKCEVCGAEIADAESPMLYRGRVVCAGCHAKLTMPEHTQYVTMRPRDAMNAGFWIGVGLLVLYGSIGVLWMLVTFMAANSGR